MNRVSLALALLCIAASAHAEIPKGTWVGNIYVLNGGSFTVRQEGVRGLSCPADGIGYDFYASSAADSLIQTLGDQYEQIMFWDDFPTTLCRAGALAYYSPVQSKTQGLCKDYQPRDFRLAGFIDMNWVNDFPDNPRAGEQAKFRLMVIGQESEHEFGMFLRFRRNGQGATDLLGRSGSHWSWFANTGGGVMEGNHFVDNGDGTYTTGAPKGGFSSFDLYMWGLIPASEVPPIWYLENPRYIYPSNQNDFKQNIGCGGYPAASWCPPSEGQVVGGTKVTVSIDDVISWCGPRVPAYPDAPRTYPQAFVLVALPDQKVERYDRAESYRQEWNEYFYRNARFRGRVITTADRRDDMPYWEFGTEDDSWLPDDRIIDVRLERSPIDPPSDPRVPLGTLTGMTTAGGATLSSPQTPPYNTRIDTSLYDTVQIRMVAPSEAKVGRLKWAKDGIEYAVSFRLIGDSQMHTYSANLRDADGWTGFVDGLALEPLGEATGTFVLDSVKLVALGTEWMRQVEPDSARGGRISGLWGDGAADMFAGGAARDGKPLFLSYSKRWTREDIGFPKPASDQDPCGYASAPEDVGPVFGVWGFGPSEVYAVGDFGRLYKRYSRSVTEWVWMPTLMDCQTQRYVGEGGALYGIWGTSPDEVFIVGENGVIHRGSAAKNELSRLESGTDRTLYSVWGSSATDVWAVGEEGTIVHSTDGRTFVTVASPTDVTLRSVRGVDAQTVFAAGDFGVVLRWDGANWQLFEPALPAETNLRAIWARNADEIYVAGDGGLIYRFDGKPLTELDGVMHPPRWVRHKSSTINDLHALHGVSERDVFAAGEVSLITHYQLSDKHLDSDGDGFVEGLDNCPGIRNDAQEDGNDDGIGDACDDFDGDSVPNGIDNCPFISNSRQRDTDDNGTGDACQRAGDGGCSIVPGAVASGGSFVMLLFGVSLLARRRHRRE